VGRPRVPVEIDTSHGVACGVHITGRYSTLALLDLRGHVIAQERLPHLDSGPRQVLSRAASRVPEFLAQCGGGRTPVGLGVALGGWVDGADGVIVEHPRLGWRGVGVTVDALSQALRATSTTDICHSRSSTARSATLISTSSSGSRCDSQ
jgi:predicted NBD/HSP70 family sugar kinase